MSVALQKTALNQQKSRPLYRFTVEQYDRMVNEGILTANDRVELLKGWIVVKMPQNPPHASSKTRVNRRLQRVLPDNWLLQVQGPITLRPDGEPEPDFAIIHGPEELYADRHPTPKDIGLLIEIADSSLLDDRRWKAELYAAARIAEYWIVNLVDRQIEVHTGPRGRQYRKKTIYSLGQSVSLALEGQEIASFAVKDLLSA